ncbi:hypothetical protein [Hymenobacter psychrophilus]|uniref:Uncharacterized protein n=1 Tax=Hymenobacter psychrophilus TaxID=651662 RepID=A0A1H3DE45_9BACT|nr:hypothetical protein [Hymenobacter psychrophilus]SDX64408.1 hypothetical protein SAMN04488069_102313 [Hymenobacter psychrophilus]
MINSDVKVLRRNTLEVHYFFNDDTHTMDAVVQNRCEYELLGIAKEVASMFGVAIYIETEPLADGGLKRWFSLISKEEDKKANITTALLTALIMAIVVNPLSKLTDKSIENIFEDSEVKELEKEKLKLEVEKLKQDTYIINHKLEENNIIKKKKSNFYESLDKYPKIKAVSFTVDTQKTREVIIKKKMFNEFILVSNDIDPIEIEDTSIEIISPVLKKGNYKWMGIYNGIPTAFNMKSNEFKSLVQTGAIQFKNGSTINCSLYINKKIDNQGHEKVTSYDIMRVNSYFENNKPVETPEGKQHRRAKAADKQQLNLFAINDNN